MTTINNLESTRNMNGGAKYYKCFWGDYSSTNYWKAYAHVVAHAYRRGYFSIPLWMIKTAFTRS